MPKWNSVTAQNLVLLATVLAAGAIAWATIPPEHRTIVEGLIVLSLGIGRFAILAPVMTPLVQLSPFAVAGVTVVTEILIATMVTINVDLLQRLPHIGPHLKRLEDDRRQLLDERPWLRWLAELGVAAYVAIPLPGTGSIGGTVLGRVIGLETFRLVGAVAAGTVVGSFALALATRAFHSVIAPLQHAWWFGPARIAVVLGTIALILSFARRATVPTDGEPQ